MRLIEIRRSRMRRLLVYILWLLSMGLLQTVWPPLGRLGFKPNFLLALASLSGFLFGGGDGLWIGLIAGFMLDFFHGRAIGLGMLVLMLGGILASRFLRRRASRNIVFALLAVAIVQVLFTLASHAAILLTLWLADLPLPQPEPLPLLEELAGPVLPTLLAAAPMYVLLYFVGPYRRRSRSNTIDMRVDATRI
ncbi:MAG: rod shape-determining protein MreD [Bacillota bacterium]|nr:rod shape-determining protein MreD [Bacillota bacterium]